MRRSILVLSALLLAVAPVRADDSPLVRLLKSGRVPAERQPTLIDQIGKRGSAEDLAYVLEKAVDPKGFAPAGRSKAFEALAEAGLTRKVQPAAGTEKIVDLLAGGSKSDPAIRLGAVRLAGLWKVAKGVTPLAAIAADPASSDEIRSAAFEALSAMERKDAIEPLTAPDRPVEVRLAAIAAAARLGIDGSADKAVGLLGQLKPGVSPTHMIAAFLDRKDGADKLTAAIEKGKPSADAAKLALRSVYELGRTDAVLVAALTKAAGLSNEVKPPTKEEIDALIAEVAAKGDAARGERIFRRPEINCMKCHAVSGAAGGVGPELSAVGQTSPVDYLIYSVLLPDQSIKEEFQTKVFLTTDGKVLQGIVVDKDDKRTILKEATGDLRTIPADEIEESKDGGSLMPKGLTNFLTRQEFVDLLRFLSELGKPGVYAIRTVPSIQRWRVLKAPESELTGADLGSDVFAARVLSADPGRWVPAYGKVNGELPLDEVVAVSGSPVVFLQGEVEVSGEGGIVLGLDSTDGVSLWVDEESVKPEGKIARTIAPGRHKLTLRVDTTKRKAATVKLEVARGEAPSAEFRVVGGR